MTDLEKLEYIHDVLKKCEFKHIRNEPLTKALVYVEDLRRYERLVEHESRYLQEHSNEQ